jgi:hypothetical protein
VYLGKDVQEAIAYLNRQPGRKVVLAMPGIPPLQLENAMLPAYLADMNPILSGFTGAYSYAGHWSETPDYNRRRSEATSFFISSTSEETRREILGKSGADYILAPNPEAYGDFQKLTGQSLADVTGFGTVVIDGAQFRLIRLPSR